MSECGPFGQEGQPAIPDRRGHGICFANHRKRLSHDEIRQIAAVEPLDVFGPLHWHGDDQPAQDVEPWGKAERRRDCETPISILGRAIPAKRRLATYAAVAGSMKMLMPWFVSERPVANAIIIRRGAVGRSS